MLPSVRAAVEELLAALDRELPGWVEGFYVVGSACLGAFRAGRSDIDFVATVDGDLSPDELARLRALHLRLWLVSLIRYAPRWPLVCNGIYVRLRDLSSSPVEVTPIAGHVAGRFEVASRSGLDVNPVTWHTLADHGIAIRGEHPASLQIHTDALELRRWSLANLNTYWRGWAQRRINMHALPRRTAAAGVLGVPRLHRTVATGAIITKEAAARCALETFERKWHPLIEEALSFWRGRPMLESYRYRPVGLRRDASQFVLTVIDAANQLPLEQGGGRLRR